MPIHDWTRVLRQQISPFSSDVDRQPGCGIELGAAAPRFLCAGRTGYRRAGSGRRCLGTDATGGNRVAVRKSRCRRSTERALRRPFGGRQLRAKGRSDLDSPSRRGPGCRDRDCLTWQQGQSPRRSGLRAEGGRVSPGWSPSSDRGLVPAQSPESTGDAQGDLGPLARRAVRASAGQAADAGGVRVGIGDCRLYRAGGRRRHPARPTHFSHPRFLCGLSPGSNLPGRLERAFPAVLKAPLEQPGAAPETV